MRMPPLFSSRMVTHAVNGVPMSLTVAVTDYHCIVSLDIWQPMSYTHRGSKRQHASVAGSGLPEAVAVGQRRVRDARWMVVDGRCRTCGQPLQTPNIRF